MHFATHNQLQWIQDEDENVIVDNVLMFETLKKDWAGLFDFPLDFENRTDHKGYREYYSDHSKLLVGKAFSKDIEYFNYRFDNGKARN